MKLTITASEAAPLVVKALFLKEGTEVNITDVPPAPHYTVEIAAQLRVLSQFAVREINGMGRQMYDRIPAIKRLREFTGYGLAKAKWAIENWEKVRMFVENHGRFPIMEEIFGGTSFEYRLT